MTLVRNPASPMRRCVSLGLLAVAAAGCAGLPSRPVGTTISGRFAASVTGTAPPESASGRFTLSVLEGRIVLDLASPLGNTLARVEVGDDGATLTAPQSDGTLAAWRGADADALAESVLGYRLPVAGLADWIAGRAVAGRPAQVMPPSGPATRIEQDGWIVTIDERFDAGGAPRLLTLVRPPADATAPQLRLRLVVDPPHADRAAAEPTP